jgi:hypothetical protein
MSFLACVALLAVFAFGGAAIGDPFAPDETPGWKITIKRGD